MRPLRRPAARRGRSRCAVRRSPSQTVSPALGIARCGLEPGADDRTVAAAETRRDQPVGADVLRLRHDAPAPRPARSASASVTYSGRTPSVNAPPSASAGAARATRCPLTVDLRRRPSVAGRKFMPGEPMKWPTNVCCGRSNSSGRAADLHRAAARHHDHLVGERQRLDLVVRDVDQRQLQLVVDLLQLAAQLPLQVRVDHRQRLVEQHRRDVLAHQAAAERDLLLRIGREAGGALVRAGRSARASRRRAPTRFAIRSAGTPRLRSGNARFSETVIVS